MSTQDTERPRVSIVVPAYQAAAHLPACLEALAEQTAASEGYEVLVVDDGSTDGTASMSLPCGMALLRHEHNRGTAAARNTGAREARGEILLFVDVDVVVGQALVATVLDVFEAGSNGAACLAVTGRYDQVPANDGWFPRYKALWTWFCWDRTGKTRGESDHMQGALSAVSRSLFWELGGFDERYEGGNVEDYEFSTRLRATGARILFEPRITGRHHFPGFFTVAHNYWARTRMWLRLRFGSRTGQARSSLRSGQANRWSAAGALLALAAVTLHAMSLLIDPWPARGLVGGAAIGCDLSYLATVLPFLVLARRQHGAGFALYAFATHFALSVVVGLAALSAPFGAGSRPNVSGQTEAM